MNAVATLERAEQSIPTFPQAHWFLRFALVSIIAYEGFTKFGNLEMGAEIFGVPVALWTLAAIGEVVASAGLIVGGFIRGPLGNLVTRLSGFGIAVILASVIAIAYWPFWSGYKYHLLMMAGGVYFAARGNP